MENQWKDIKFAYKLILENAFSDSEQQDAAHTVLLRFFASAFDLMLSGDPVVKTALAALLGDHSHAGFSSAEFVFGSSARPRSNAQQTAQQTAQQPPTQQTSQQTSQQTAQGANADNMPYTTHHHMDPGANVPHLSNVGFVPNMLHTASILPDFNSFINNAEGFFNSGSSPNMTSEELHNIFPFLQMFDGMNSAQTQEPH